MQPNLSKLQFLQLKNGENDRTSLWGYSGSKMNEHVDCL